VVFLYYINVISKENYVVFLFMRCTILYDGVTLRANFIISNLLFFFVILICMCYTASLGARLKRVYDVITLFLCLKSTWLQSVAVFQRQ